MDEITRRDALKVIVSAGATGAAVVAGCAPPGASPQAAAGEPAAASQATNPAPEAPSAAWAETGADAIVRVEPLGFPWKTPDPFLFCVYHDDAYPKGDARMAPVASLAGRNLGMDFEGIDGWRMYHGHVVPGFPAHPHRGFETVTIVRRGLVDHSDSMGAAARYGRGDVQWLTAGKGIQHSEMFPLVYQDQDNPLELFQIWLNLPAADKFADPHFSMFWGPDVPRIEAKDEAGRVTEVTVIAGRVGDAKAPAPPPKSYASRPEAEVAIWTLKLAPGARWTLPAGSAGLNRMLYFFHGQSLKVGGKPIEGGKTLAMRSDAAVSLEAGPDEVELLMLQGRPIGEPVAQRGPFVMNTQDEIRQAFADYQRTRFGGWPWGASDPVHPREEGRFAKYLDGRVEKAPS